MDKQRARQIIRQTFENPFDKQHFTSFIKNLLNKVEGTSITYPDQFIPEYYKQHISSLERLGKYNDGENRIDILIITLKKTTSLERARTMQRNLVAWYINGRPGGEQIDAALVAYVSPDEADWRFSLVKMDYRFENKDGKAKVREEFTPAKRWSFLVGANEKSHTAQSRLIDILVDVKQNPSLADLEEAFNIETVTKEFFLEYRGLFLRTKEALDKVASKSPDLEREFAILEIDTVNFAKKLLGQIIFLYFLQKKGWFGVGLKDNWGTGSKGFLRELYEKRYGNYSNFFNEVLEPLFYEALRSDRRFDDDYYSRFNCKIPFLNGGLFDPMGNYRWAHVDINLPNSLFSNRNSTPQGDIGDGILDIFDRYNFTVKEDEPLEKEVAIDPELLGKAYEKFNAIRPDNYEEFKSALKTGKTGQENKFNKKFGVYYTPREIVHYMCQQSLIHYLAIELDDVVTKEEIETFIFYGDHISEREEMITENKGQVSQQYQQKTSNNKKTIPESIQKNAMLVDKKLAEITVCDPAVGSGAFPVGMMNEIVRARAVLSKYMPDSEFTPYELKRRCIEHSLYGVDIDPGAVEIAKLRLWLSLVVDEEDIKNIKPLPNLDYKVVCGNSLIGLPDEIKNIQIMREIESLKSELFSETHPEKKQKLQKNINSKIETFFSQTKKNLGYEVNFDFRLIFSEIFRDQSGFDLIVANPPYVDSEMMVRLMPKLRKRISMTYITAKGNWDLYIPFWELSVKLLNNKGSSVFITPNKWLAISYGSNLRNLLRPYVYKVGNCDEAKIFEAGNSPVIVFISKNINTKSIQVDRFDSKYNIREQNYLHKNLLNKKNWGFLLSKDLNLVVKIMNKPLKVNQHYYAENPFTVSEAYEVQEIIEELDSHAKFDRLHYFKFVNTGTIDKYLLLWSIKPTTYIKKKYQVPAIKKNVFEKKFPKRFKQMSEPKLIISGMRHFECAYDPNGIVVAGKSTVILKSKKHEELKVVLAILNSKLISFYIKQAFGALGIDGGINFTADLVENLPFPEINNIDKKQLTSLTDTILNIVTGKDWQNQNILQNKLYDHQEQIDKLVYKLYNLTQQEIEILEDR